MKTQAARLGTYMYYAIYVHFKNKNNMLLMDTYIVEVLKHDRKDTVFGVAEERDRGSFKGLGCLIP